MNSNMMQSLASLCMSVLLCATQLQFQKFATLKVISVVWPFLLTTLLSPLYTILTVRHRFSKRRNGNLCADCMRKTQVKLLLTTYMNRQCARIQFHQRHFYWFVSRHWLQHQSHCEMIIQNFWQCQNFVVGNLWSQDYDNIHSWTCLTVWCTTTVLYPRPKIVPPFSVSGYILVWISHSIVSPILAWHMLLQ